MIQRAFCRTKDQETHLREYGTSAKDIWLSTRGAESLEGCLATFRGRPGVLVVAHDLRVLAGTKREVAAIMSRLEAMQIRVVDISHPEDNTVAALMRRADNAISQGRFLDPRTIKKMGQRGGLARGRNSLFKRQEIAADWVIRNVVNDRDISWTTAVRIFGGKISEATLRRHYYNA